MTRSTALKALAKIIRTAENEETRRRACVDFLRFAPDDREPRAEKRDNRLYAKTDGEVELFYIARSHKFRTGSPEVRAQMMSASLKLDDQATKPNKPRVPPVQPHQRE